MTIALSAATLRRLWPHAPQAKIDAYVARWPQVAARYGLTTRLRALHFWAQVSHECGGGTIDHESGYYTTPQRVMKVWPRRFPTVASAVPYLRDPDKLFEKAYGGRVKDLGNTQPGDGAKFFGRGLLQLTGRGSYRAIGKIVGLPLEDRPELAISPLYALAIAAAEFQHLGCLPWCDKNNIEAVTKRVNGGYTDLGKRKAWYARWAEQIPEYAPEAPVDAPEPVPDPPEAENMHPEPPELPRGSDEVLPPGVDHPDKDSMGQSKTGWAAVLAFAASIATTLGELVEQVKPLLTDPHVLIPLALVGAGACIFIWFDRHKRLRADRV